MSVLVVIPARMKATRLPNKPMAMIGGVPMIVQVWRRAMEAAIGDVVVACDGEEIAHAVRAAGGVAVVTDPDHPSGSDRVWEVVKKTDYPTIRLSDDPMIINLQGDVPTLDPQLLHAVLEPLANPGVDIATLATEITRTEEHENPAVVKAILSFVTPHQNAQARFGSPSRGEQEQVVGLADHRIIGSSDHRPIGRALYFTRATAPANDGPRYHHIGVYAYRYQALKTFVSLPPSPLELREKLEQLRALEHGLRVDVRVVDTVPLGVDTPEDLARAREILGAA